MSSNDRRDETIDGEPSSATDSGVQPPSRSRANTSKRSTSPSVASPNGRATPAVLEPVVAIDPPDPVAEPVEKIEPSEKPSEKPAARPADASTSTEKTNGEKTNGEKTSTNGAGGSGGARSKSAGKVAAKQRPNKPAVRGGPVIDPGLVVVPPISHGKLGETKQPRQPPPPLAQPLPPTSLHEVIAPAAHGSQPAKPPAPTRVMPVPVPVARGGAGMGAGLLHGPPRAITDPDDHDEFPTIPTIKRSVRSTATTTRRRPRVRRVTRVVRHVDPWSVFKVALGFSAVLYGVCLTAGVLLWNVAYTTGTVDNVERFFESFGWDSFEFKGGELFHNAWIAGLFAAIGLTGAIVLGATLFNLITDLVGGVRVTVLEEEVVERDPLMRRQLVGGRRADLTVVDPDDPDAAFDAPDRARGPAAEQIRVEPARDLQR